MKRLALIPILALALSACGTTHEKIIGAARTITDKVCESPENYRLAVRKDIWECCGIDTSQACVDPTDRVKPPTIR